MTILPPRSSSGDLWPATRYSSFDLTQEFLAQVLAVRRASVSDVAQSLAEDDCITYTRGTITILDRARLQHHACDCYLAIIRATDRAARPLAATDPSGRRPVLSD